MGFEWDVEPEAVFEQIGRNYAQELHAAVYVLALRYAPEVEAWMKSNAPWTDRTAAARQTLFTEVEQVVNETVELVLSHGVEYGWYLEGFNPATAMEMKNAGRWAIIGPALDHFLPKIWADVQALLR